MKVLRRIGLSILMVLFLTSTLIYAQNPAKESYDKGVEYAIQEKFKKAKEEFERVLKVDPFFSPAEHSLKIIKDVIEQKIRRETAIHLFKGVSYINKGQFDKAISDYTKALKLNPKYADGYNNRGIAYDDKGQYTRAIRDHTKALKLNPKDAKAYHNRGISYYKKGQIDRAISDYTKALEINPKHVYAYNNRGIAYANKGQDDQAISDYTKALEINPKFNEAYNNRGLAYVNKGCADWKKACEFGKCGSYNFAKQNGDCP